MGNPRIDASGPSDDRTSPDSDAGHGSKDDAGPLRIVLIAPPYFDVPPPAYGGVEAVVADLADALVARGHDVTLIGAGKPGTAATFVPTWEQTIPERLGEPFPEVVHAAVTRRAVEQIAGAGGVDVIHDHTLAGPLNAPSYAAMGLPTVVTMHGPVDEDLSRYYGVLGQDINLVAISERQRQLAPELNWVGMVHNAVRVETWPFRSEKGGYALFLGRYHPNKAPHLALDAAHAAGVPLVLAGKCAEPLEKEYFDREIRPRLLPDDHVFGLADAQQKRELLANAQCLLFPVQWEEPFGMVMIEAMACGTPVVALRGGAVPEVVVDGVTGIICDHPDQLADAMAHARKLNPADCRQLVAEHFNSDQLGAGYERAYVESLARFRSTPPDDTLALLRTQYAGLEADLDRHYADDLLGGAPGETDPAR
ncbi:MAG: glycosyltransferase family 4 protein [Hamadaea sp.]|nr:glycosyltransferase family 4 protein [Hamadaea sp.]